MPRKRPLEAPEPEEEINNAEGSGIEQQDEPPKKSVATLSVEIEEPELNAIGGALLLTDINTVSDARPNRPLKAVPQWMQAAHRIPADNTSHVEQLPLPEWLLANLRRMGLERCFPVQAEVIPKVLASAGQQDFCVCAPTGSGKTLAYALPIIATLSTRIVPRLRALVILPTRDLALQVKKVFVQASEGSGLRIAIALGQRSFAEEQQTLLTADILVATPGRLVDHLVSPNFTLEHLRFLVLDEADRLLMQAYQEWLPAVLKGAYREDAEAGQNNAEETQASDGTLRFTVHTLRSSRPSRLFVPTDAAPLQKLLFSATLTQNPQKLASLKLHNPSFYSYSVTSYPSSTAATTAQGDADEARFQLPTTLKEHMLVCAAADKPVALYHLVTVILPKLAPGPALCFTSSVDSTHRLYLLLSALGLGERVAEFSGSLPAAKRAELLADFARGNVQLLICSDVMTRGMDLPSLAAVINYDVPQHLKTYVHRVGRTARAGQEGAAFTLLRREQVYHFKLMLGGKNEKRKIKELPALKLDVYAAQFRKALADLKSTLEKEKYRMRTTTADANSAALLDALRTQATINFMQK